MTEPQPLARPAPETDADRLSWWRRLGRRLDWRRTGGWFSAYVLICLIVAAAAGFIWYRLCAPLPLYHLDNNFSAQIDDQGLAQIFSADVWLCALGLVIAPPLGYIAWRWFGRLGWPSAIAATLAGLGTAYLAQAVGRLLGPGALDARLAAAQPGDPTGVPVELTAHTPVYLAFWVALAILPVLIASSLVPTGRAEPGWRHLPPSVPSPT